MKYFGDIELIKSKIINLWVDPIEGLPPFFAEDESRLIYNLVTKQLYFNNGSEYLPLQVASEDSQPLIQTLGQIWIDPDNSFNPVPFNELPGDFISGLSSTDSLFTVISQINAALLDISVIDINDIQDFNVENPQAGDLIYFDGTEFVNIPLSDIPDFAINISLNGLNDVVITGTPADNDTIFFNSADNKFENKKWSFIYENLTPQTTQIVTHNLNVQFCTVTVINRSVSPPESIEPTSIIYDNGNQLTVNLPAPFAVTILVTTVPIQ